MPKQRIAQVKVKGLPVLHLPNLEKKKVAASEEKGELKGKP